MLKSLSKSFRFDFKTKNGTERTDFNFSRFIHLEVKKAGKGYILEPARYPTPAVPVLSRRLIADDQTARETEVEANRIANEGEVTASQHLIDAASQAAAKLRFNFHQAAQALNPVHAWPPGPNPHHFRPNHCRPYSSQLPTGTFLLLGMPYRSDNAWGQRTNFTWDVVNGWKSQSICTHLFKTIK